MSEPNELSFQVLSDCLEILERNADTQAREVIQKARECVEEIEARLAPAHAQSREEEASLRQLVYTALRKAEKDIQEWRNAGEPDGPCEQDFVADSLINALRSRQSPQASALKEALERCATRADAWRIRHVGDESLETNPVILRLRARQKESLRDAVMDEPLLTTAPQPSPQGEDADWCDLMADEFTRISHLTENEEIKGLCDRAITNTKQHFPVMKQRDDFYARWTAEKARAEELEARLASAQYPATVSYVKQLETFIAKQYPDGTPFDDILSGKTASAQSSAQGEEAREMREDLK